MLRCVAKAGLAGLIALMAWSAPASVLEKQFYMSGPRYDAAVPACEFGLPKIQQRFATKEGRFWNSDLQIVGFERVREIAFRPWAESAVPRRFCTASALVSDGKRRPVHYSIIEDSGMIGASWDVQWCVIGLDRNWAYNPNCKMALP
ncbi:unnamed protein product [Phaeothamnion confervicola]